MIRGCPCYKCERPQKCAECHISCKEYINWSNENTALRKKVMKEKDISNGIYSQGVNLAKKMKRKHGEKA